MNKLIFSLLIIQSFCSFSQDCSGVNTEIIADFSYINKIEDLEMPLNQNWEIAFENQKAVLVFFKNESEQVSGGIVKNKNGYFINSAHDIGEKIILEVIRRTGVNLEDRALTNVKIKNIPAKQVEYNHKVFNLGDTYLMAGIMYMIVNDGYTYVFMFNCPRNSKKCYIPFFKDIIKNTYFGPEWY